MRMRPDLWARERKTLLNPSVDSVRAPGSTSNGPRGTLRLTEARVEDPLAGPVPDGVTNVPPASTGLTSSTRRLFVFALGGTLLLLVPLLVLAVFAVRQPRTSEAPSDTAEAQRPFDLPALAGGRITERAFAGQVVVVNVWASWCGPCREEAPVLSRMSKASPAAAFYGMVRLDEPRLAKAFAESQGLDYPHALDNGTFATAHQVTVLPTTLVFARDGSFVGRIEGPVSEARLQALIDDALAVVQ